MRKREKAKYEQLWAAAQYIREELDAGCHDFCDEYAVNLGQEWDGSPLRDRNLALWELRRALDEFSH